ncbi:hypothetical protein EGW08_015408 [Elysia chlorotica]|uniref:Metalloendopeptidase n=1 Tax=Elysia chlorotica TaxID=188477 RepID=A0A3S1B7D9_ELYCH|nr:hypothetical protein EGW08_015408 [Elysia chlorotica]
MIVKRLLTSWIFVSILLVGQTDVSGARISKKSVPDLENNGEGMIESYLMARDIVQDLIDEGKSPDPNGDEMRFLDYWRSQLQSRSDLTQEDLKMIFKGDPGLDEPDVEVKRSRTKRTIEANPSKRWTGGVVPYVYMEEITEDYKVEIQRAMDYYHRFSCIRFVPWENVNGTTTNQRLGLDHPGYIKYVDRKNGCWSLQGNYRWSDGQDISCCTGGTCVHELGHALGMLHEQQSPNPDRNRFIRINPQYITDDGQQWYVQRHPGNFISHGYDINSPMHYSPSFYSKGPKKAFSYLFHDLDHGGGFYYHTREVSIEHKCQDQCKDFPVTCENDGYLTKVDGKCACMCIPGLDPATGCKKVYRHDPPGLEFPGGQYALPAHNGGCPDDSFVTGSRKHFSNGHNDISAKFSLKADISNDMVEENFCVKNSPSNSIVWPEGNYCIYRKGGSCPDGFFFEGSVKFDDQPTDSKPNSQAGELPDGEYGADTKYHYCCKNSGFDDDVLFFPSRKPLVLIKLSDQKCQKVRGMHLEVNTLTLGNSVTNGTSEAALEGYHPVSDGKETSEAISIKYCAYKPAMIDCGGVYELDPSKTEITFSSPDDVELECFWLVKAPKGQRLALDFTEFDISGFSGMCKDDLIVRYSRQGQPGKRYCGNRYEKTIVSLNNTIHITLSTYSAYKSRFTAKVRLIQDEDLCYKRGDRGLTYDGDINFTRNFEPCLPWHEMTHCEAHPFKTDIYNTLLSGNECRTPDQANAFQPWCYTDKQFCTRNYCDVCLIGKLVDRFFSCDETKAAGECPKTSTFDCAKTCFDKAPPLKAKDVRCPAPPDAFDGTPVDAKASYAVGEAATYKCNYNDVTAERLCLSSGQWATLGTVCSECPMGWHKDADNKQCYRYFGESMKYAEAVEKCKGLNAKVTTAKSQEENSFVTSLIASAVWLGLTDDVKEGEHVWVDGEALDYSNWNNGEPNNWNNIQDCVELTTSGKWNDRNCENGYGVVCKRPVETLKFCLDFWDKCRDMLEVKPSMCTDFPEFAEVQCRQTCGVCSTDSMSKCSVEPAGANSKTTETRSEVPAGTIVTYSCDAASNPTSGDASRLCTESGTLSGSLLKCVSTITTTTTTTTPIPTTTTTQKPTTENSGCGPGWVSNDGQCYKFVSPAMSFREAAVLCKREEATLVTIKSKEKNDFISSSIKSAVWLGATDTQKTGTYTWMDQSALIYDNRAPVQSETSGDNEDCVEMDTDGAWNGVSCYETKRHGVCEKLGPSCPDNWFGDANNQNCYWYVEQMLTFREAAVLCKRNGANLVSIQSMEENDFVMKSIKQAVWIGATDVREEGNYIWMDLSPVSFFNWKSSGSSDGDCLEMKMGGRWDGVSCAADKREAVCEKPGKTCPSGWTLYPATNKCYHKFDSITDQFMSIVECLLEGYGTVSIRDEGEQNFVNSLKGPGSMWLGLEDSLEESVFAWADNTPLTYTNWQDGRPDGIGKEDKDCVIMTEDGKWSDVGCDNQFSYMCTTPLFK